ncbi:MAG: LysR family transcriptional regulator [Chloroflexi bacterium]|nr:LysR family transcriptional regulator [Chloroflexota bacterium]
MLIKQIEAFVEVVRRGTVSRAADALGITQPALTARLHAIERELGQPLFARSGRGVRLTDAGRVFCPHAERALAAVADGRRAVDDLGSGRAGKLILGATPSVSSYVLPRVLKRYREEHPGVELTLRTGHSEQVVELVAAEAVDLAIVRDLHHDDLEVTPLYDDELSLVTHPGHPFALRGSTTLSEVVAGGLLVFDRASSYFELTHALFTEAGVPVRILMELDNFEAAKRMIEEGLGVALLPKIAVARELELGQLASVPIDDAGPIHRRMVAIRRADAGPPGGIVGAFLDLLVAMVSAGPSAPTGHGETVNGRTLTSRPASEQPGQVNGRTASPDRVATASAAGP